jgi:hypothetical protein
MTLHIGPFDYLVVDDEGDYLKSINATGECDYEKLRIIVDPGLPFARRRVVVMHEVLHAILNAAVAAQTEVTDEQRMEILAGGLVEFAMRNEEAWHEFGGRDAG